MIREILSLADVSCAIDAGIVGELPASESWTNEGLADMGKLLIKRMFMRGILPKSGETIKK